MKTLKSLTLFTALFVLSACSTSGNNGGTGGNGDGGNDAFLTTISKYSKMTGINGNAQSLSITDGGKTLEGIAPMTGSTFTFDKSTSATVGKYTAKVTGAPSDMEATVTISGKTVSIKSLAVGSTASGNIVEFTLE